MTSNIWGGNSYGDPTKLMSKQLFNVYNKYSPDVIGFQEASPGWYGADLFFDLGKSYNMVGTELYNNQNWTPIAVKKEYKIVAYGFEELDKVPGYSKSITWVVIQKDEKRFGMCNTHFWWMRGNEAKEVNEIFGTTNYTPSDHCNLRNYNAKQLSNLMHYLNKRYSCPVFAFGDMNVRLSEEVFDVYAENGIKNLYDLAQKKDNICSYHGYPVPDENGVFHGKKSTDENGYSSSLDHMVSLGDNFDVKQYCVVQDQDALDATDHSPVFVDVCFK